MLTGAYLWGVPGSLSHPVPGPEIQEASVVPANRQSLTVQMFGPDVLGFYSSCSYLAMPSGGTPPYSYEWKRDGVTVSTSEWYTMPSVTTSGFGLAVYITDAASGFTYDSKYVFYDPDDRSGNCGPI